MAAVAASRAVAAPDAPGWTAAEIWRVVIGTGTTGSFLALLAVIVKTWVPIRKMRLSADETFRGELMERVEKLESKIDEERARCEADLSIMRHRMNNVTMCFDALLLLIETAPEKAADHVAKIKAMRVTQQEVEAKEKATYHAAKVAAGLHFEGGSE